MSIKINQLEIENVKRIRAVAVTPAQNGLTVIGGNNNQGKTSILDTIAWALGGDRYRPSSAVREGSAVPPHIKLTMSNGLTVERSGKNSALKVTDPTGKKSGQQLLNEFVEELAINLPRFLQSSSREKADTLLKIIGVGDQVHALERKEAELYNRRHTIGQEADRKRKYAQELPFYPDAPKEPVSISELIQRQQTILARNGENQRLRDNLQRLECQKQQLRRQLDELQERYNAVCQDCDTAARSAAELQDESTDEIERDIANIEATNIKVRTNGDREKAEQDAQYYSNQYEALSDEIDAVRRKKYDLLNSAALPLPGLSVEESELTYRGKRWDCMSGSDQLKVATAIVRAINPQCGFVLLDKLEQMDMGTLQEFGAWLEDEGLQAIATRVSTGDECSIIIEDGYSVPIQQPKWRAGEF